MRNGSLTTGPIPATLIKFIIPIFLGNVIQQMLTTTDRIIVGRVVGKEGFAAVGVSFPVIFLLAILLIGIFTGSSILLGHAIGSRQHRYRRKIVDSTYALFIIISIVIAIVGQLITEPIIRLLGIPAVIRSDASNYLRIIFLGFPGMTLYYGSSAMARAAGDSRSPLIYFGIAAIGNVVLDLLFVAKFGWGVSGSAWATIMMQTAAGLMQSISFHKKLPMLAFRLNLKPSLSTICNIIKMGLLTALQQATVAVNSLVLQIFVNGYGIEVLSGFVAGSQIDTYGRMLMLSTMIGLTAFVSQNIGARQEQRALKAFAIALLFNIIVSAVLFLTLLFFGDSAVALFNADSKMIAIGAKFLHISSGFYWLISIQFCMVGFLRGAGATLVPACASILASLLLPLLAFILSSNFGYIGLWYAMPANWLLLSTTYLIYFLTGKWKNKLKIPTKGRQA